jgi:hypothetical protein
MTDADLWLICGDQAEVIDRMVIIKSRPLQGNLKGLLFAGIFYPSPNS